LIEKRGLFKIIKNDAAAGTDGLRSLLAEYIDEKMMKALAAEYRRGRTLDIGTTNLDAARPVTWNVTRIAASGHPKALELIRQIILASASIPVAFPPVYIEIEKDGQLYDEMHVDGGATTQVYLYPPSLDWRQ
ncbi:MAG: patatin, partial [candidate division Zixibacteria bacterium]|nr:patatin [candidate division Zixibacteria bacterium]